MFGFSRTTSSLCSHNRVGRAHIRRRRRPTAQKAEDALIKKARQADPNTRICTLRGIYYGTEWSLDFKVERKRSEAGARIRNAGFLTYTGGNLPADPRPVLGQTLFEELQGSQSIHDAGYGIDVGHVLIGLETRTSANLRTGKFAGQGGQGWKS